MMLKTQFSSKVDLTGFGNELFNSQNTEISGASSPCEDDSFIHNLLKDKVLHSSFCIFTPKGKKWSCILKALFNNVFTIKNLSCMALHAISVFGKV